MPAGKIFLAQRRKKKKTAGQKALKMVRRLNRGIEKKFYDVEIDQTTSLSQVGFLQVLNDPAQGDADDQRNGDKITMTSIMFKGRILNALNDNNITIRILLLKDREATLGAIEDIFVNTLSNQSPLLMFDVDKRSEYVVLMDKTWQLANNDNSPQKLINFSRSLNFSSQFAAGTADVEKNCIFLVAFTNVPAAQPDADKCRLIATTRVRYTDL